MGLAGDQLLRQMQRALAQLLQWLGHRGQSRIGVDRQFVIIEPDDRELLRNLHTNVLGMVQGTDRHMIVETKQRGDFWMLL